MVRRTLIALLALVGSLSLMSTATAGGWAVSKLDAPVGQVVVNQPATIHFSVLQHGVTPVEDGTPRLIATNAESGTTINANGVKLQAPGHFSVNITFTEPGRWKLIVYPDPFPTPNSLPTVTVLDTGEQPAATNANADPVISEANTITISGAMFSVSRLEIKAGTTVAWENRDSLMHEVAFIEPTIDDSGILATGERFTFTFNEPGTYNYYCGPHPGMSGTIIVS